MNPEEEVVVTEEVTIETHDSFLGSEPSLEN